MNDDLRPAELRIFATKPLECLQQLSVLAFGERVVGFLLTLRFITDASSAIMTDNTSGPLPISWSRPLGVEPDDFP